MYSGDSIRVVHPLFQEEGDGAIPISPLQFHIGKIDRNLFSLLNETWHSRLPKCTNCFEGVCYGAIYCNVFYAVAWWSKPIAQNRLKDGKSIYELRRMAIADDAPKNTASRMLKIMIADIKRDMPHINKVISYQDTEVHSGTIYKASGWRRETEGSFTSWKNRTDFNRSDQSTAKKSRWAKLIRQLEIDDDGKK